MLNSNRTSSTPIPKAVCRQCSVSRQRRAEWCVAYGDTARPVQGLLDQCLFRTLFILFLACQSVAVGNYQSFTLHETSQSFSNRIVPAQVMVMAQLLFFFLHWWTIINETLCLFNPWLLRALQTTAVWISYMGTTQQQTWLLSPLNYSASIENYFRSLLSWIGFKLRNLRPIYNCPIIR